MKNSNNTIVALRLKPIPNSKPEPFIWTLSPDNRQIELNTQTYQDFLETKRLTSKAKTSFKFDYCFPPNETNSSIYDNVVKPLVSSSLLGFNATLFMYGQAGSGKTFTMLGSNLANSLNKNTTVEQTKGIFLL